MFTIDDLKNDNRFYIDDATLCRLWANGGGDKYKVVFARVGMIMRSFEDKIITLYDMDAFSYLQGTTDGVKRYHDYCLKHQPYNPNRNEDEFDKLIDKMKSFEYDIKRGAIIVNEENFILDGQHRCCIILNRHGPFYKIPVVKCYSSGRHSVKHKVKIGFYKLKTLLRCIKESLIRRKKNGR